MSLQIASASNEVKIWDVHEKTCEMNLKTSTYTFTHPISSISWNHTNQVIATAYRTPAKISLFQTGNGQLLSYVPFLDMEAIPSIYENHPVKVLSFSNNSRYLACGIGEYVHLWDLKRKVLKFDSGASYSGKGSITTLTYISEMNDMVSGDSLGHIRMWNSRYPIDASSSSACMQHKDGVGVTCMQMPALGSTRLAAGYEDGSLVIWDPITFTQLKTQSVHRATMTSLGFSPKNSRLVATVGEDGILTLIDTAAKTSALSTPSASIQVGEPLHCLSFHEDAIHTAVGTSSGQIIFYDWRNVKKPIFSIDAHSGTPVYDLKFQAFPSSVKPSTTTAGSLAKSSVPDSPETSTSLPRTVTGNQQVINIAPLG
jgi:protein NEDD1